MRVNVYNEEMTKEVEIVTVRPPNKPDHEYVGVRLFHESASTLHATPQDDDRSAVTFWCDDLIEAELYFENVVAAIQERRRVVETDAINTLRQRPGAAA